MALTNRERVHQAIELLREGLEPFVERMLKSRLGGDWVQQVEVGRKFPLQRNRDGSVHWDTQALLKTMIPFWQSVFNEVLGQTERSLVGEIIEVRNAFAHEQPFSSEDAERALDSIKRLLDSISAKKQAEEVNRSRLELRRVVFTEQVRAQERRKTLTLEGTPKAGLLPWREIVTPHPDVSSGTYQQAEFAADLAQVHRGEGVDEYRDPTEFFARTYITEGLRELLKNALLRLSKKGGDPVVELQTNFGGGKTHSMLGLYHLFGAGVEKALPGVEAIMKEAGVDRVPVGNRAVLVGTALSPGQPETKPDGTVVRTLWGHLAWQLGGPDGYAMVADADANGTSPGSDLLKRLFDRFGPCLVLIDEWVAYARQLYHVDGLPAGSFDANLTFVQALTESAKASEGTLVVASLPASQIEIGGKGGEEALARLKNTFSRLESTWRPATADEGFEIVRRRLFQNITDERLMVAKDATIKAFARMYADESSEFPQGTEESSYRERLSKAFPIHPELFDRLYEDWGSLDKFQRTRGVLRLMAAVIHALWTGDDKSLLIMPASIPIDLSAVKGELTRYLEESWDAVLASEVDGETSLPRQVDKEVPNLQRYSAARRVARAVYIGSAPRHKGQNPGVDDRRIKLGVVQPGEPPSVFGDALRRLANKAAHLHSDSTRYWYSTQPSLKRLADDRAAAYEQPDVWVKIVERIRKESGSAAVRGDFAAVHVCPATSGDVADEMETRLVILSPDFHHATAGEKTPALEQVQAILMHRGTGPRIYRNTLVFLAADRQRLAELEQSVRLHMAWTSIVAASGSLDLTSSQAAQAKAKQAETDNASAAQLKEAWKWLIVPGQSDPHGEVEWVASGLSGQDPLPVRASKKLVHEERLMPRMGPTRLAIPLRSHLWGEADHLNTRKLVEYLASYLYLPRVKDGEVVANAIREGISQLVAGPFGYAESWDEAAGRYDGLKTVQGGTVTIDSHSVVVRPEAAKRQEDADEAERRRKRVEAEGREKDREGEEEVREGGDEEGGNPTSPPPKVVKRFFGSIELDPDRVGRQAGRVAEEVIQHLSTLPGAKVSVTLEVTVEVPGGVPETERRVVTENAQTLKFKVHSFEEA